MIGKKFIELRLIEKENHDMKKTLIIIVYCHLIIGLTHANSMAKTALDAKQADIYFQNQKWQQAADAYHALTQEEATSGLYWLRLGQSLYHLEQCESAKYPLQQALEHPSEEVQLSLTLLFLARCHAVLGDRAAVLRSIGAIEATGARPYLAVKNSVEFSSLSESPEFIAALDRLKPCATAKHRAFDLWLGEWEVTSPNRDGWVAHSSITVSNDGCSIHESYTTPSGYTGKSINFYDIQKQQWHQTWIDNQGAALYLEGALIDQAMVLSNDTNRVTWSVQTDGGVRQHWESTSDEGLTWSTAFDGYYSRVQ